MSNTAGRSSPAWPTDAASSGRTGASTSAAPCSSGGRSNPDRLVGVIGISLLTLVPGISGGSETYARELVRALGRVGELDYRVFLPHIAPDVDGLPAEVVPEYRASRSMPGRIAAMSYAALWRRPLVRRFAGLEALHFPLSVMLPPVSEPPAVTSILDVQHEFFPAFF